MTNLEKLSKEFAKLINSGNNQTYQSKDERFWNIETDKAGNGYAVIRFLDSPEGEDLPFVRVFKHGFKGPTGLWYIENSLTTLNRQDPVGEYNSRLWNSGLESDKKIARDQKRKLRFYSNILVIKDSVHPENEGKVFLYEYGRKIYNKLDAAMNPKFDDEKPINPFDYKEGANFKLKVMMVDGYRNYDKSEFDKPSKIGDDTFIKKICKQQYSLQEFLDEKNFKSYDELKEKLERVLDLNGSTSSGKSDNVVDISRGKTSSRNVRDVEDDFTSETIDDSVLEDLLNE